MGIKKTRDIGNDNIEQLYDVLYPFLQLKGEIPIKNQEKSLIAHLFAIILNAQISLSEEKLFHSFGADDIIPIKIEIRDQHLHYWGKIYWLSTPKEHRCHLSYQDPFYGILALKDDHINIQQMLFGDDDLQDLDDESWIKSEINWMYEL